MLLHYAVVNGFLDIVSLLVERGASVDARDDSGVSPLDVRDRVRQQEAARILDGRESYDGFEGGGSCTVGPSAPVPEHIAEVQPVEHDWSCERESASRVRREYLGKKRNST
jgi:hypothetical protein